MYNVYFYVSQGLCAVKAVLQALGKLHRKEDQSAVMIVFHVQKEKSVMRQVIFISSRRSFFCVCFPSTITLSANDVLAKEFINKTIFLSFITTMLNFLFRFK